MGLFSGRSRSRLFSVSDFSYCKEDRTRPEIEEILAQNGFLNKVAIAIDAAGGEDCPEEEKYFTAELLGFSAFINIRPGLPGFSLNVHNFRQPVKSRKNSISGRWQRFLDLNLKHNCERRLKMIHPNFITEIILSIEGCEDDNPLLHSRITGFKSLSM